MEEIPKQEDVCVVDRLRSEEVVGLDRGLAVLNRLGLVLIPVLRVHRQYMRSDIERNI